jgi:altronate dehydratase large subunit
VSRAPVADASFDAYERDGRSVGVRNRVLVLPSVICSRVVADRIADRVPRAVSTPHDHGCAQMGADHEQTRRTFVGTAANPNVAGTVVVGLGCEHVQSDELAARVEGLDLPVRELSIQGVGGTDACVERGVELARDLADSMASRRTAADLGDLTVGLVSGDVRTSTREVADPLLGALAEAVVDAGGRVLVAGADRAAPHEDDVLARAADGEAVGAIERLLDRNRGLPPRASAVGTGAARLSFEAVSRSWGDLPVVDALAYGERATHGSGLAIVDAPSRVEEAATGLAAAGAQLVVHATADGVPTGHPVVPVVKVSGSPDTVAALPEDVDVDATATDTGAFVRQVRRIAGGEPSATERHGLDEFALTRVGPSM